MSTQKKIALNVKVHNLRASPDLTAVLITAEYGINEICTIYGEVKTA